MSTPLLTPPERVAGYKLGSLIGRGGMSLVYRAEHTELRRTVALKFLDPSLSKDDSFRHRFLSEARLAASIDHPNVLPIYEAGESEGWLYFTMRLVQGPDLADLLRAGPLDGPSTVRIVSATGHALSAAHRAGLVHRDVKPQNILIDRSAGETEHIYLCDFGLTKDLASTSRHTMSGQLMGSIHYASPEQIDGATLDARTDVYALGCVLYECLTGQPPFLRESDLAVLWAHVGSLPPSVRRGRRHLPKAVDDVIAVAMAKTPEARYESCDQMVADLERAFSNQTQRTKARRLLLANPLAYREPKNPSVPDLYGVQPTSALRSTARSVAIGITAALLAGSTALALAGGFLRNGDPRSQDVAIGQKAGSTGRDGSPVQRDKLMKNEDDGAGGVPDDGFVAPTNFAMLTGPELGAVNALPHALGRVPEVGSVPYPPSGRYTYRQTGASRLCQNRDGFEVCPTEEDLPTRQHLAVTQVPGFAGGHVLLLRSFSTGYSTEGYSTEVVARYGRKFAAMTRQSVTFRHQGAEFSFSIRPQPRITILRWPLEVETRWSGAWTGPTSGRYVSEIVTLEWHRVAGRKVRVAQVNTQMRFSGKNRGHIVTSEWFDVSTGVVVKSVAAVRWSDGVGTLKAAFRRELVNGPSYRRA